MHKAVWQRDTILRNTFLFESIHVHSLLSKLISVCTWCTYDRDGEMWLSHRESHYNKSMQGAVLAQGTRKELLWDARTLHKAGFYSSENLISTTKTCPLLHLDKQDTQLISMLWDILCGMPICMYSMYFPEPCLLLKWMRKPVCFSADKTGGGWCFLCMLVGVCVSVTVVLALFICVCLSEGQRDWKNVFFTA